MNAFREYMEIGNEIDKLLTELAPKFDERTVYKIGELCKMALNQDAALAEVRIIESAMETRQLDGRVEDEKLAELNLSGAIGYRKGTDGAKKAINKYICKLAEKANNIKTGE